MSARAGTADSASTLAFVESPVQLLNVLEWAHHHAHTPDAAYTRDSGANPGPQTCGPPDTDSGGVGSGQDGPAGYGERAGTDARCAGPGPDGLGAGLAGDAGTAAVRLEEDHGPAAGGGAVTGGSWCAAEEAYGAAADVGRERPCGPGGRLAGFCDAANGGSREAGFAGEPVADPERVRVPLTIVVLTPTDPMTRGQLRRMAELARDEGHRVRWEEARGGVAAPLTTIAGLVPLLRAADRVVIGDPFSRYVQLLLTITRARDLAVVDDGTATMEFVAQLARGERLVRWHRRGGRPGPRDLVFAPVSAAARRRLIPNTRRRVEMFSSMPVDGAPDGVRVTVNDFSWTRARFGPPRIFDGTDLVGTSLVETGVVDTDRYLAAVHDLARTHGATRYFAHRREDTEKLHRLAVETGLQIVRPDLPLELVARRGPVGHTVLSFPSTVVHTLPPVLAGTGVKVAVCDIEPVWLTDHASPRARDFLAAVSGAARDVERLPSWRDQDSCHDAGLVTDHAVTASVAADTADHMVPGGGPAATDRTPPVSVPAVESGTFQQNRPAPA